MRTIEFAEKYALNKNKNKLELYNYQKDLLNEFDDNRYTLTLHSRLMGGSTMVSLYLANWLLHNQTDMKRIILLVDRPTTRMALIRDYISNYCKINELDNLETSTSTKSLLLKNGNSILITNTLRSINLSPEHTFGLVVDNAAWVHELLDSVAYAIPNCNKIIMVSGFNEAKNDFYDKFFLSENNVFKKIKLTWDMHPEHDEAWYKTQEEIFKYGGHFYSEVHLVRKEKEKTNPPKNNMINVRLSDELVLKVSQKLLEKDISVSEYIRQLIERD